MARTEKQKKQADDFNKAFDKKIKKLRLEHKKKLERLKKK